LSFSKRDNLVRPTRAFISAIDNLFIAALPQASPLATWTVLIGKRVTWVQNDTELGKLQHSNKGMAWEFPKLSLCFRKRCLFLDIRVWVEIDACLPF
jgi:hypothetical protein